MARGSLRRNIIDGTAGVTLALVVFLAGSEAHRIYSLMALQTVPAAQFFEPVQLNVPDFQSGEDPIIFYDRIIHQEFTADWVVEVQNIQSDGTPVAVCTGTGHNIYQPEKGLPEAGSTLEWFVGAPCYTSPGSYRLVANWIIDRPETVGNVSTRLVSNVFQVTQNDTRY